MSSWYCSQSGSEHFNHSEHAHTHKYVHTRMHTHSLTSETHRGVPMHLHTTSCPLLKLCRCGMLCLPGMTTWLALVVSRALLDISSLCTAVGTSGQSSLLHPHVLHPQSPTQSHIHIPTSTFPQLCSHIHIPIPALPHPYSHTHTHSPRTKISHYHPTTSLSSQRHSLCSDHLL